MPDEANQIELLLDIVVPLLPFIILILLGLIAGKTTERRHFRSLDERERETADMVVTDIKTFPGGADPTRGGEMVLGEVVIATDYLKTFFASFRKIFGGEVKSYDLLLQRARREAILRMKGEARSRGYDAVCNVRLASADIGGMTSSRGAVMVEALAWGTAYKRPPKHLT